MTTLPPTIKADRRILWKLTVSRPKWSSGTGAGGKPRPDVGLPKFRLDGTLTQGTGTEGL